MYRVPLCFLFILVAACLAGRLHAAPRLTAPGTVAGHALMVGQLSTALCRKIETENGKRPFKERSQQEINELFQQLMISTMTENTEVMNALLKHAESGADSHAFGEMLGRDVVLRMLQICPASQELLLRMSATVPDGIMQITPAEQPRLEKLTTDLCQQLNKQNAAQALATRTPQDRQQLFTLAMSSVLLQHRQELQQQYGEQATTDATAMSIVGRKMGLLMAQQCPTYLLQVGQDYVDREKQTQAAPAPPKAPTPAKKKR